MNDLVVAGGGPVGLVTAIAAATAGLDVVVVEPRPRPVDKACGEGLMPDALATLRALGVDPPGADFAGIRYLQGRAAAEAPFRRGLGRGVRRTVLHEVLLARARDAGVTFVRGRVRDIEQRPTYVRAGEVAARYLVGADGLHSDVRRAVGLAAQPRRGSRRYGVRQHFSVREEPTYVEVYWLRDSEVYVTPVAEGLVGVAVLGRRPLDLSHAMDAHPMLRSRLAGAQPAGAARGAGPLHQRTTARVRGRVLLVGDAAGYVDALTGEGLRIGFAEAHAAVAAIAADRPQAYEKDWSRITRSYRTVTTALVGIGDLPALRPFVVPVAQAVPGAFTSIVNHVGG